MVQALTATGAQTVEPLKYANEQGYFLTNAKQWKGIPVGKRPCQYLLKVYMEMAGWTDTNVSGVMVRSYGGPATSTSPT
jgi:hypothetical protein